MEHTGGALDNGQDLAENEHIRGHTKRIKERENAALQTHLTYVRMESETTLDCETGEAQDESRETKHSNGLSSDETGALPQTADPSSEVEPDANVNKDKVEERTLTDHLNKRLLSSFLEKLNQKDLALPGIQRLDCAIADEDSNRAAEEW